MHRLAVVVELAIPWLRTRSSSLEKERGRFANPLATILSAAMMFDWLGERHDDSSASQAADHVERAVRTTLESGDVLTADLGGNATTTEVTDAVINNL